MDALDGRGNGPGKPTSLRVLVADDEPMVRMAVRLSLEERGHRVQEARNADEAFALAGSEAFDVLLVDVRMPGMPGGGLGLLDRLAKIPARSEESASCSSVADRTVLLSANLSGGDAAQRVRDGQPHLRKPFRFEELVRLVERIGADGG